MARGWQMLLFCACFTCTWVLLPSVLSAQDNLASRKRQSAELTGKAAIAFNAGELERARDLLLKAREAFANPIIDYNLGRAYEGLAQPSLAVDSYTRYLIAVPDAPNAGLVRQRIERLSEGLGQESVQDPARGAAERQPEPEPKPLSEPSSSVSPWPFLVAGLGVVGVGVGLGLHLDAQAKADEAAVDPVDQVQAASELESARDQNTIANIVWASGAALTAAGIVWLIAELVGDEDAVVQARGQNILFSF